MSQGIVIEYDFSGDEQAWRAAVDDFLKEIAADPALAGRFHYEVNVRADGSGRVHVGHWDTEETLAHLQSQPFFARFSSAVQGFADAGLKATKFSRVAGTDGNG